MTYRKSTMIEGLATLRDDVRFAVRTLRRNPIFTVVSILTLAAGLGSTTAIGSVGYALMLRPQPGVQDGDRLVEIDVAARGGRRGSLSYPEFLDVREGIQGLQSVAGWSLTPVTRRLEVGGESLNGLEVTGEYFGVLGAGALLGRVFSGEDTRSGGARTAVISHRFWVDRMGSDRGVLGSTLVLNGREHTVIGIADRDFDGHSLGYRVDVWLPVTQSRRAVEDGALTNRDARWLLVIGKLRSGDDSGGASRGASGGDSGADLAALRSQLLVLSTRLAETYPSARGGAERTLQAVRWGPLPEGARGMVRGFVAVLTALVVLVLFVTCANMVGMILARGLAREREMATRAALGGGRGRLVRQLVVESQLLFIAGGLGGLLLANVATAHRTLENLPFPVRIDLDFGLSAPVILGSLLLSLLAGTFYGLVPARLASSPDLTRALKNGAGSSGAGAMSRMRKVFVGAQIATSVVLLTAGGLFYRSLGAMSSMDVGFVDSELYVASFDFERDGISDVSEAHALQELLRLGVAEVPGVRHVTAATDLPLDLQAQTVSVIPESTGGPGRGQPALAHSSFVGPNYFEVLGTRLLMGRGIEVDDRMAAQGVAVVNETFGDRFWPGQSPLGQAFLMGGDERRFTIVGVAEEVKTSIYMDSPVPKLYVPMAQRPITPFDLVIQSSLPLSALAPEFFDAVSGVHSELIASTPGTLAGRTSLAGLPQQIGATLIGGLALIALLLSGLGLYGVIAFGVVRQTREIGIRLALGASGHSVMKGVLAQTAWLVLPAVIVGGAAAVAAGTVIGAFLVGVEPTDPVTLTGVVFLLAGVSAIASAIPARRAMRVEPASALRAE